MIHTLTIIRFLFPFLLLLAFFCLYKKPYRCMQSFMWRMVVFELNLWYEFVHGEKEQRPNDFFPKLM